MKHHDNLRDLVALAVAGMVSEAERSEVREHLQKCAQCRDEFADFTALASSLSRLPGTAAPAYLAARTLHHIRTITEAADKSRWNHGVLAFLIVFSWCISVLTWPVVRMLGAGFWQWLLTSALLAWATAGSAALILLLPSGLSRSGLRRKRSI